MKNALIVTVHKQSHNWQSISKGIAGQSKKPDKVFVAIDRPQLDSQFNQSLMEEDCKIFNVPYEIILIEDVPTQMSAWDGVSEPFLAGRTRNLALQKAIEQGFDAFYFIDGDCIPQKDFLITHERALMHKIPVLSVGRRREKEYSWRDRRECDPMLVNHGIFREGGYLISSADLLKASLIVWSCNFAMNKESVSLILKFNKEYFGKEELFNSEFDGAWGGEDGFLGLTAWLCKVFITTISERASGVNHISHPRPSEKYTANHKIRFDYMMEQLRKKVKSRPLSLDFFTNL